MRWLAQMLAVFCEEFSFQYRQRLELRRAAEFPSVVTPRLFGDTYSAEMSIVNDYIVRDAQHRALHRFSPAGQTPEA